MKPLRDREGGVSVYKNVLVSGAIAEAFGSPESVLHWALYPFYFAKCNLMFCPLIYASNISLSIYHF